MADGELVLVTWGQHSVAKEVEKRFVLHGFTLLHGLILLHCIQVDVLI